MAAADGAGGLSFLIGVDNHSRLHLNGVDPHSGHAMYVCICNALTDRDINAAVADGTDSFASLRDATGCSNCCGNCEDVARSVFDEAVTARSRPLGLPSFAHAA